MRYFFPAARLVYTKKRYRALHVLVSFFVLSFAIFLPQKDLLLAVWQQDAFSFFGKLQIFLLTPGTFFTNFTVFSQITTLLIALMFGSIISFASYYTSRQIRSGFAAGTSTFGIIVGFFGIGCSACGSVLLSSIIGISSTVHILGFLPFQGKEFTLVSVLLLSISLWYMSKKIVLPPVCVVTKT